MKIDLYTKSVLTVIAICLILLVFKNGSTFLPTAHAGYNSLGYIPLNEDGSINVRLSDYDEMDVVITGIDTYDKMRVDLRDVSTNEPLDVNIDEIGGGFLNMGGPLPVKLD